MVERESLQERHARLLGGPRLGAATDLLDAIRAAGVIGDDRSSALAMLIVDAGLDGDEPTLHYASRQLQVIFRALARGAGEDTAEDRGRALALIDVVGWAFERALASGALAEIEQHSTTHEFLKTVSEEPGLTNSEVGDRIGVSDAEVSRVGRRLADASLVAKRRLGRRNHWEPTPKGIQTLELLESGGAPRFRRPHYQIQ